MLATHHPIENSLRWLRRSVVILLLLVNLMAVTLAGSATPATNRHITTLGSSIQVSIDDIAARVTSHEAEVNPDH